MSDGRVVIDTELDSSGAERDARQLGRDIQDSMEESARATEQASEAMQEHSRATEQASESAQEHRRATEDDTDATEGHTRATEQDTEATEQNRRNRERSNDSTEQEENNTHGATQKLKEHKAELERLKTAYADSYVEKGRDAEETQDLNREIRQLTRQIDQEESALNAARRSLDGNERELRDVGREADSSSSKLKKFGKVLGSALKGAGKLALKGTVASLKTATASITATSVAIGGLVKSATDAYASYEQLVGGVDTLFKDSSQKVQQYAADAYKTAGLSGNDYMETVTGFSASLLQSLEGDTEKAADVANRAIVDMSDNANKMGTAMESIQNAYGGFAKQNYTMLDNLKLGYGGTKEEMQRLISDAAKMTDIQNDLNVTVKDGSLDFANIVNAISVMQTSLDITGTTAKEAATTIEGSANSMKAAWNNLLVGISDDTQDFDTLINNFVESAKNYAANILPRIEIALQGAGKLLTSLLPIIIAGLPEFLGNFLKAFSEQLNVLLPQVLSALGEFLNLVISMLPTLIGNLGEMTLTIITMLLNSFTTLLPSFLGNLLKALSEQLNVLLPQVLSSLGEFFNLVLVMLPSLISNLGELALNIITMLLNAFIEGLPQLLDGLTSILTAVCTELMSDENIETILTLAIELVTTLIQGLADNLPKIIQAGITLVVNLAKGLLKAIPELVKKLPQIISSIVTGLLDSIPAIVDAGIELLTALVDDLPAIIDSIIEVLPQIITSITNAIINAIPKLIDAGFKLFVALVENMPKIIVEIVAKIPSLITSIIQALLNMIGKFAETGWTLLTNLVTKLPEVTTELKNKIKDLPGKLADTIADGIDDFIDIGGRLIDGLWDGITGAWDSVKNGVSDMCDGLVDTVTGIFDIHSPSKVFSWIGKMNAEGLVDGFVDNDPVKAISSDINLGMNKLQTTLDTQSSLQFDRTLSDGLVNYNKLGDATAYAINKAGIKVKVDGREFGRIVRGYA